MENIGIKIFNRVYYLAYNYAPLIFFSYYVCVHEVYQDAYSSLINPYYFH